MGFGRALAAALLLIFGAAQADAVPAEAFAVLPDNSPRLSPDGKYFAIIRDSKGRPAVAIYELGTATPPVMIVSSEFIISNVRWAKDDVLLVYSRVNKKLRKWDEKNRIFTLVDATSVLVKNGFKLVRLSAYADVRDIDLDDADDIYVANDRGIQRYNVRSGQKDELVARDRITTETTGTYNWYLDGHGRPVARTDYEVLQSRDRPHGLIKLSVSDNGTWREIATYPYSVDSDDGIWGLSSDGRAFIRRAEDRKSTATINRVDLGSGRETVLFNDPKYDAYYPLSNEWTDRVDGFALTRNRREYHYLDPGRQAIQDGIEKAFPGLSVHVATADRALKKVIVEAEGPRTPVTYYLLDRTTHQATSLVAAYPALDESMLGEVRSYPVNTRDGLEIDAYLTLPPGRTPKNLPLVVMPHGGPDERDDMGFDWWAQFLANRGYAVLKPNFRGSSGYGRAFTEAGFNQWGLKMQDDISDAVAKTVADGIADPRRICIAGASYGGYAALAGAAFTPKLYACAISFAGVSHLPNILGFQKWQSDQSITDGSFAVTRIGDGYSDIVRLNATSPALHAENITVPILLMHAELDNTVPISQSEGMEIALKQSGKKVEFVRLPGDDHYLSLESTRLTVLRETERFLKANIGN